MESKHKHLEFIQATISRMSNNSFLLKGWTITVLAAIIGLNTEDLNTMIITDGIIVTLIFWILDGYYLFQERYFRQLYNEVRIKSEDEINFSMILDKNPDKEVSWKYAFLSKTIFPLYAGLIIAVGILCSIVN